MRQATNGLAEIKPKQERIVLGSSYTRLLKSLVIFIKYLALIVFALFALMPFAWMLSTSLKPAGEVLSVTPSFIPANPTLANYTAIAEAFPIGRILINSVVVAIIITGGQILFCSMAAFAFARIPFKGREVLFILYLATLMIPQQVTITPLFILMTGLGWVNTYQGLILPGIFSAFGVFLMRQSFMSFPREYEEAAFLDGATYWTVFRKLVLPLSRPALATLSVLAFMSAWNAFLWPLFVTRDADIMTLPVALATLQGRWTTQWNLVMAGAVLAVTPILLLYIFAQRYFVQGMTMSGLKG